MFIPLQVKYLGIFGGKDVNASVRNILSQIMINEVATKLNWAGSPSRKGFKEFTSIIHLVASNM